MKMKPEDISLPRDQSENLLRGKLSTSNYDETAAIVDKHCYDIKDLELRVVKLEKDSHPPVTGVAKADDVNRELERLDRRVAILQEQLDRLSREY